jgi:hypothetical protein
MIVHSWFCICFIGMSAQGLNSKVHLNSNRFEFQKDWKRKKERKLEKAAQPASSLPLGPALFSRGPLSPSPLPHAAQPARSPARVPSLSDQPTPPGSALSPSPFFPRITGRTRDLRRALHARPARRGRPTAQALTPLPLLAPPHRDPTPPWTGHPAALQPTRAAAEALSRAQDRLRAP